jgi:uncharacterized protein (TIGR01777 family)
MKIIIGGGSGMIGSRLLELLQSGGHEVLVLSRSAGPGRVVWQPEEGLIDADAVRQADAIVNLAGAGIADKRWSSARKALIISSRVSGNTLLAQVLTQPGHQVKYFLSASAIGFYGDRANELLTENSASGTGFLAESCRAWEASAHLVAQAGVPTGIGRVGIVLSTLGGALPQLAAPVSMGVAPVFGSGNMYYPWIHIDDVCGAMQMMIEQQIAGTVNLCGPESVTFHTLMSGIRAVKCPWALMVPVPPVALRLALGEMADTVLGSNRVSTEKLKNLGFSWQHPDLIPALKHIWETKR